MPKLILDKMVFKTVLAKIKESSHNQSKENFQKN